MPANVENSAVATGLLSFHFIFSFHSNPKERQCQRMLKLPHYCTHLSCSVMSNSATPWTAAHQASLSITNYLSLLKINWKILKEMGIPDHLICLLRNLYAGQEATVRTRHETTDWFQIGKGGLDNVTLLT